MELSQLSKNETFYNKDTLNGYSYEENLYAMRLMSLIGVLSEEDLSSIKENYGITEYEYYHPNAEVIEKVENMLTDGIGVNHR